MKILRLTATFGGLENREISFADGLNIVTGPNEAGKSTLTAFIRAMLYGIDTAKRRRADGFIPDKEKYRPRSGLACEGMMEVEQGGRIIRLERSTARGGRGEPMKEFRAVYADSGETVPGMTSDNAGLILTGLDSDSFDRVLMIRQGEAAISPSAPLEKRMASIAAETSLYSFSDADGRLADWSAALAGVRGGGELGRLLPRARMLNSAISRSDELYPRLRELSAQLEATEAEAAKAEAFARAEKYRSAAAALERREAELKAAEDALAALPSAAADPARLGELSGEASELIRRRAALDGLNAPEMPDSAAADEMERTAAALKNTPAPAAGILGKIYPCAIFALMGIGFMFLHIAAMVGALALSAVLLFIYLRSQRIQKTRRELAAKFDTDDAELLSRRAAKLRAAIASAEEFYRRDETERAELSERTQSVLVEISAIGGCPCGDLMQAREQLSLILNRLSERAGAEKEVEFLRSDAERLRAALPEKPEGYDEFDFAAPVGGQTALLAARRDSLRQSIMRIRGELDGLGDLTTIRAEAERLDRRIQALNFAAGAIAEARSALAEADEILRARFSPAINRLAGKYMSALTAGRYSEAAIDRKFAASSRENGKIASLAASELSTGTAAELWLSVRLALCELLCQSSAPLVLDDALMSFDDDRAKAALELLSSLSRQCILFTCHTREKKLIRANVIDL